MVLLQGHLGVEYFLMDPLFTYFSTYTCPRLASPLTIIYFQPFYLARFDRAPAAHVHWSEGGVVGDGRARRRRRQRPWRCRSDGRGWSIRRGEDD
ncbi:putative auxin-responsive protein SAUR32 [Iris pallida]|uniref:Auxin-responsive protein SAUR32 n=1 Tax=Iris pallida TaxID=29817 RepID=A0AAX6I6U8_IRIPA|nr:putative auxin-responsive protein SAUR32 [Iris pallida]